MKVQLRHHYGWVIYDNDEPTLAESAYAAVRQSHDFLTDTNHTWTAGPRSTQWGGKTVEWNSVLIYRGEGAPPYSGPEWLRTDYWFDVEYRSVE